MVNIKSASFPTTYSLLDYSIEARVCSLLQPSVQVLPLERNRPDPTLSLPNPSYEPRSRRKARAPGEGKARREKGKGKGRGSLCCATYTRYGREGNLHRPIAPVLGASEGIRGNVVSIAQPSPVLRWAPPRFLALVHIPR